MHAGAAAGVQRRRLGGLLDGDHLRHARPAWRRRWTGRPGTRRGPTPTSMTLPPWPSAAMDRCSARTPSVTLSPRRGPAAASTSTSTSTMAPPGSSTLACFSDPDTISPGMKFIFGVPRKPATNRLDRMVVQLVRRADLLDAAAVEDDDALAQRHRLDLVVGDVDHCGLQLLVQAADFHAHLHAQAGRPGWTAARRTGTPPACARWRGRWRRAGAGPPDSSFGRRLSSGAICRMAAARSNRGLHLGRLVAGQLERESHVFVHRHVRVQRVRLEHHGQLALRRGRCRWPACRRCAARRR